MKFSYLFILYVFVIALTAEAKSKVFKPFGWATMSSMNGGSYSLTGGEKGRTIVLRSDGTDMRQQIMDAICEYDKVVLDGSNGDFIVSETMRLSSLKGKSIVGINGARLCTEFHLTPLIHQKLDSANVLSLPTKGDGNVHVLKNGHRVKEVCEYVVRSILIDNLSDMQENYRKAGLFHLSFCENMVFRNLKFVGPGAVDVGGDDLMTSTDCSSHLWIDHCEFIDGMDGNFDIKGHSDFITISWTTFSYTSRTYVHANTNLIGSNDNPSDNGIDKLNVTFAYCVWGQGCNQRMPMVRFGTVHLLNNYYSCIGNSAAINPRFKSEVLIEGNYFEKGVKHIFSQKDASSYAFRNNFYSENFDQPSDKGYVYIPYKYKVIPVAQVPTLLTAKDGSGATLINEYCQ